MKRDSSACLPVVGPWAVAAVAAVVLSFVVVARGEALPKAMVPAATTEMTLPGGAASIAKSKKPGVGRESKSGRSG